MEKVLCCASKEVYSPLRKLAKILVSELKKMALLVT